MKKQCKTIRLDQVNQLPVGLRQESEDAAITAAHRLSHLIRIGGHCRNRCGMDSLGEDNGESECDSKSGPDQKSWMDRGSYGSIQTNGIQWDPGTNEGRIFFRFQSLQL